MRLSTVTRRLQLLLCLVGLSVLLGCAAGGSDEVPPSVRRSMSAQEWTRLPDLPLSPRTAPVVAATSDALLVVGGDLGPPCPPGADCATGRRAADGAAYSWRDGSWSPIADAPRPLVGGDELVVEGRLHVLDERGLLTYEPARDSWTSVRVPATDVGWYDLAAAGTSVLLVSTSDELVDQPDLLLDPVTGRWSRLPEDPLGPSFDRQVVDTDAGLVLLARRILDDGQPADPAVLRAAVLPDGAQRWRRLPDGDQLGGGRWFWDGERLVDPTLGGADGGEVDGWGRTIPYGGTLDPVTGTWRHLTDPPDSDDGGWPVEAGHGSAEVRRTVASEGWLASGGSRPWIRVPRPDGAPELPGPAAWEGTRLAVVGGSGVLSSGVWVASGLGG